MRDVNKLLEHRPVVCFLLLAFRESSDPAITSLFSGFTCARCIFLSDHSCDVGLRHSAAPLASTILQKGSNDRTRNHPASQYSVLHLTH